MFFNSPFFLNRNEGTNEFIELHNSGSGSA